MQVFDEATGESWEMSHAGTFIYQTSPLGIEPKEWGESLKDDLLPPVMTFPSADLAGIGIFGTIDKWVAVHVWACMWQRRGPYPNVETEDGKLGWIDMAAALADSITSLTSVKAFAEDDAQKLIDGTTLYDVPYLGEVELWTGETRKLIKQTAPWKFERTDKKEKADV